MGDLGILLQNGGAVGHRPGPRRHLDADPVPELLAGEELYQPHLAAPADVGAAAGAAVRAGPGDDPHRALQGLLAAVRQGGQGFAVGPAGLHRVVLPDVLVGQGLDLRHVLRRQGGVEVDGHQVPADVEAHVVAVVPGAEDAADDVLPAVLLHEVEAAGEVDLPRYRLSHRQRAGAQVDHLPLLLMGVGDRYAAQDALVTRLAAPLGVEGRAVQNHLPAVLPLLTGEDLGGEFFHKSVVVVKFFCHKRVPFFLTHRGLWRLLPCAARLCGGCGPHAPGRGSFAPRGE